MAYKRGPSRQGIAKARKASREERFRRIEEMRQNTINRMRNKMKPGMLTGGQAKIAAKAPPRNKIDGKDFAVLRAEKAKGRGMGLQDEKMKPGKIMKAGKGTSVKISGEKLSLDKALRMQKEGKINPKTGKFTSIDALRESKGFKPGESAKSFNQRQAAIKFAKEGVKATRVGKIVLPIALAGVAGIQYLKSRIKKNKEKAKKKMGGGMMMKPIMANKGKKIKGKVPTAVKEFYDTVPPNRDPRMTGDKYKKYLKGLKEATTKPDTSKFIQRRMTLGGGRLAIPLMVGVGLLKVGKKLKDKIKFKKKMGGGLMEATQKLKAQGKMGGGMMQRPMMAMGGGMMPGYKKGKSVMAKGCKLGRKKPTKMYT